MFLALLPQPILAVNQVWEMLYTGIDSTLHVKKLKYLLLRLGTSMSTFKYAKMSQILESLN
jgi:hypothetical protein